MPVGVRVELGVAQLFLRIAQLRLGRVDLRLGGLEPLLGLVELSTGGEALFHQRLLALEGVPRLGELALGRRQVGLGRAERVLLDQRVEPGHELPGLDAVSDIDPALEHAPVDPEREAYFILGADLPREADGRAAGPPLDGHGANRTGFGWGWGRLVAACEQHRNGQHGTWDLRGHQSLPCLRDLSGASQSRY